MRDIKDFYILGLPIQTEIGECHFLKIKDYPDYFMDLQIIGLSKDQIYHKYYELNKNGELDEFLTEIKKLTLYEIVLGIQELQQSYLNIFMKVFDNEEVLSSINQDNFDYYRKLVMYMNCLKEEKINPNPEIQKAIERSRRVKSQEGEKLEFSDMASSIVVCSGKNYDDLNNMSIYQFYMTFYRIGQFKNYDTSTLFATVASDKVNIESWSKHIDLYEEEKHFVEHEKFKKTTGSLFNE